jgi:hypothetical protein
MTETSIEEENMAADLRQRYNAINANIKEQREQSECGATVPIITKALSWSSKTLNEAMELARDAIERLEQRITITAPPVCVDSVKWQQKPLASYSIEYGGRGQHTVEDEIPIPAQPIDIREFTCRRA